MTAYATIEELAAALRITVTAANTSTLEACLEAAVVEIDDAIDAVPEAVPSWSEQQLALLNRVNVLRGVEWFKANDAAFGVLGFDQTGAVRIPKASFTRHALTLLPLKEQFGVA